MCYTLYPSKLLAYLIAYGNNSVEQISFSMLKTVRLEIEAKTTSIYVDITKPAICSAVNSYPDILEIDDTKVIIVRDTIDEEQKEYFKKNADQIPIQYLNILKEVEDNIYNPQK
jgi:hypothetical protein